MIKVLLADDHILMRLGLKEVIESHDDMIVVCDVASGAEAITAYATHFPDVIIMDMRMPGGSGAETTAELLQQHPEARVLILSVYEGEEDIWRAVNAGAMGYLTKGADAPCLLDAISSVASGESYFPSKIAQKLKRRKQRHDLTKREMDVLKLLVQGLSNKEISAQLSISGDTVKLHLSNIFEKIGVADRTQAVLATVQRGIMHLDD